MVMLVAVPLIAKVVAAAAFDTATVPVPVSARTPEKLAMPVPDRSKVPDEAAPKPSVSKPVTAPPEAKETTPVPLKLATMVSDALVPPASVPMVWPVSVMVCKPDAAAPANDAVVPKFMVSAPEELWVTVVIVVGAVVVDKPAAPVIATVVKPAIPVKSAVNTEEPERLNVRAAVPLNVMNDAVAPAVALIVEYWLLASVKVTAVAPAAAPLALIVKAKVVLVAAVEPPVVTETVPPFTTPLNDTELRAGELIVTLPLLVVVTEVMVPAKVPLPAFKSLTVTAPVTTPETAAAAVARAVWVAVTAVVSAPPVKVIRPPVMVLLTAPAKLAVTVLTVPPLTLMEAAVAVVAVAATVSVTVIVPVVRVVAPACVPALMTAAPVMPVAVIAMFWPPATVMLFVPVSNAWFSVAFWVWLAVMLEALPAGTAPPEALTVTAVKPVNAAAVVSIIIPWLLLTIRFLMFDRVAPAGAK